MYERVDS